MAYGFRHVPPRPLTPRAPQAVRCSFCKARLDVGMKPHICKEVTYGTSVTPTKTIPFDTVQEPR